MGWPSTLAVVAIVIAIVAIVISKKNDVNDSPPPSYPQTSPTYPAPPLSSVQLPSEPLPIGNHSEQQGTNLQVAEAAPRPIQALTNPVVPESSKLELPAPITHKLNRPTQTQPNSDFFTVGSTKDEVLAIQGTPTRLSDNEFAYDYSRVEFRNDRVISWNDISKILKTRNLPK
jgi:hypothetical protein